MIAILAVAFTFKVAKRKDSSLSSIPGVRTCDNPKFTNPSVLLMIHASDKNEEVKFQVVFSKISFVSLYMGPGILAMKNTADPSKNSCCEGDCDGAMLGAIGVMVGKMVGALDGDVDGEIVGAALSFVGC